MTDTIILLLLIPAAYLLGSVPFGLIIAKVNGKDLRAVGSGNIGATNVARALGRRWAYVCFVLDVLKGFFPVFIAGFAVTPKADTSSLFLWLAVGCAAVLGHIFPIYLKFKGGKGVATSLGVALGIWPYFTFAALISFLAWLVVLIIWRYVSLASIIAAISFPVSLSAAILLEAAWPLLHLWPLLIAAIAIPLLVIIRHRENIKRILAGTETKAFHKKTE